MSRERNFLGVIHRSFAVDVSDAHSIGKQERVLSFLGRVKSSFSFGLTFAQEGPATRDEADLPRTLGNGGCRVKRLKLRGASRGLMRRRRVAQGRAAASRAAVSPGSGRCGGAGRGGGMYPGGRGRGGTPLQVLIRLIQDRDRQVLHMCRQLEASVESPAAAQITVSRCTRLKASNGRGC
jgi:hypothetical protein